MRPLTPREQEQAESLALALADVMMLRLPVLFAEEPEAVVGVALPLAEAIVRSEARACRHKKRARRARAAARGRHAEPAEDPAPGTPAPVGIGGV